MEGDRILRMQDPDEIDLAGFLLKLDKVEINTEVQKSRPSGKKSSREAEESLVRKRTLLRQTLFPNIFTDLKC